MEHSKSSVNSHGSCVVHKCCSSKCHSSYAGNSYGQSIFTSLSNNGDHINKVLDSSAIYSEPPNSEGTSTIYLRYSIITIKTSNISQNSCGKYPLMYCNPHLDNQKDTCSIEFCSIRGNSATNKIGIFLDNTGSMHQIKSSNFIENTVKNLGLIYSEAKVVVQGCTILENTANYMFYTYSQSDTITVINCTITKEDVTKTNNNKVNIDQWTPNSHSFINGIKPTFVNELCSVGYDIVGTLTPNIPDWNEESNKYHKCATCDESFLIFTHNLIRMFLYSSIICSLPSCSKE